jgi:hypothetical protein
MQLTTIKRLLRRFGKKSPPDLWEFGLDVREVMSTRISRAMAGDLSAAEARRMVLEKQAAGVRAQIAYAQALLGGDPISAGRRSFDIYHQVVRSNRKRLCKRRWL